MLPDEVTTSSSSFNVKDDPDKGVLVGRRGRLCRRHSVGFRPDAETQVVEFDVYDDDIREVFWYSRDEYDIIKARNSLIVKMMKTGHFRESNEHTFRGLEHKLKEGFKQRRANKFNGLNAVLEEQDRQYARGVIVPEAIAEKYSRVALRAVETAFVVAMRDFESSYCFDGVRSIPTTAAAAASLPPHLADLASEETQSDGDSNVDFRPGYVVDDDTIASDDSTASKTRKKIRGLFSAVSMAKRKEGKMNRRSSM